MSDEDEDDDEASTREKKSNGLNKPKKGGVTGGEGKTMQNSRVMAGATANQKKTVNVSNKQGGNRDDNAKNTRTKERTITDIIEKVSTWRKLYNGVMVPNPQNSE